MGTLTVLALRIVLAMVIAGSVVVQTVIVPLLAADLKHDFDPSLADVRLPVLAIVVMGIVTIQVTVICVWRLLTMVKRSTVFSVASFRYVDVIFGATAVAAVLTFALGATLAPGEGVPPGIVALIGGAGVIVAGIALIILVLRMLLAQAVARDAEAHHLQAELSEVI